MSAGLIIRHIKEVLTGQLDYFVFTTLQRTLKEGDYNYKIYSYR